MPSSPLSQPELLTTLRVRAGVPSSCPWRTIRTRPGLSVSQIAPSAAKASAQGATSPSATLVTLKLRGCGDVSDVVVGVAVGRGDDVVAVDEPPNVQPLSTSPARTPLAIRRDINPMLAAQDRDTLSR